MSLITPEELEKALSGATPTSTIPWLSDINQGLSSVKDILAMLGKLKGSNLGQAGETVKELSSGAEKSNVGNILGIIQSLGLGDVPIGKILSEMSPYSVNQLKEMGVKFLEAKPGE